MRIDPAKLKNEFLSGHASFLKDVSAEYGLYCVRYLCSKHKCQESDARGIFTDALIAFRESIITGKVTEVKNLRSYLLGMCLNIFQLQLRKERRKSEKYIEIKRSLYLEEANYLDKTIEVETHDSLKRLVIKSLSVLDQSCQEIIRYFYVDGLSMNTIAAKMGFASSHVAKTTKSRCFKKWVKVVEELKQRNYVD